MASTLRNEETGLAAPAKCLAYDHRSKGPCVYIKSEGHPWCAYHVERQGKLYKIYKTLTDHFASYGAKNTDTEKPSDPNIKVCIDVFTIKLASNLDLLKKWYHSNLKKWRYGYRALEARKWHHQQFHNGGDESHQRYISALKRELRLLELAMDACDKRVYKLLLEKAQASWIIDSDDDPGSDEGSAEELAEIDAQGPPSPRASCGSTHSHGTSPTPTKPKYPKPDGEDDDEDQPDPYATRRTNLLQRLLNRYPAHPLKPGYVASRTRSNTCDCGCWCSELSLILDSVLRRVIARSPALYVRAKSTIDPKTGGEFQNVLQWLKYEGEGELTTGDLEKLWRKVKFPSEPNNFGVEFLKNSIVDGLYRDHDVEGPEQGERIWVLGGWVYRKPDTSAMCERGWDLVHKFVSCPCCAESVCQSVQEVTELRMNMLVAHYRVRFADNPLVQPTRPALEAKIEAYDEKNSPETEEVASSSTPSSSDAENGTSSDSDIAAPSTPLTTPESSPKKWARRSRKVTSKASKKSSSRSSSPAEAPTANNALIKSLRKPTEPSVTHRHCIPYERWIPYDESEWMHVLRVLKVLLCRHYTASKGKIENYPLKSFAPSTGRRPRGKVNTVYSETQGRHWIYVKIALDHPYGQAMVDALIDDPNETYTVFARNGSTMQTYFDPVNPSSDPEFKAPKPPSLPADPYAHTLWYERVRSSNSPLGRRDVPWTPKAYWGSNVLEQLRDMGRFPALRESTKPNSKLKAGQERSKIYAGQEKVGMKAVWEVLVMDNWFELDLGAEERESGYGKNERSYDEFVKGVALCLAKASGYQCEQGDWNGVLAVPGYEAWKLDQEADEKSQAAEQAEAAERAQAERLADELGI